MSMQVFQLVDKIITALQQLAPNRNGKCALYQFIGDAVSKPNTNAKLTRKSFVTWAYNHAYG